MGKMAEIDHVRCNYGHGRFVGLEKTSSLKAGIDLGTNFVELCGD